MDDDKLRQTVLTTLGLKNASKEEQDAALYKVESIAQKRFAAALPDMLNDEQIEHVEAMRIAGKSDEEMMNWVEKQIPEYDEMIRAIVRDVAEEAADF